MRIWEGIYSIEGRMGDCCIYVVDCGEEIALIDAGLGRDVGRLVKNIEREGLNMERLKKVFVTHCHIDHIGGLWNLKRRFGCKIIRMFLTRIQ
ncbi:MAG: MBL fold metallo-hydrolase [Candidatus Syntropharchaeia archaeon]